MQATPGRRWWPLAVLAGAVTVLAATGVLPRWGGLVHLVALPPLDVFADMRILVARAPSYPTFVAGLVLSLAVRTAVLALLLGGLRRNLRFAAAFYAVALGPAVVAAILEYAGQAGLYARLFWPGAMVVAAAMAVLGPAPWTGALRVRTAVAAASRSGLRIWALGAYAAALLALGAAADAGGPAATVAAVPFSAALTLAAIARLAAPPGRRPLAALGAAVVAGGAAAFLFDATRADEPRPAPVRPDGSVVLMSGINSASGKGAIFEIDPIVYGFPCERTFHYSYAGPGPGVPPGASACPIRTGDPYEEQDTQRPLQDLVESFHQQAPEWVPPTTVIAHSQAPWVAWAALPEHGDQGVSALVLLGAFPGNPLGYPPPDEPGPGRVGGDGLRLVAATGQALGFEFEADAPLARELLAQAAASSRIFAEPLPPEVDVLSVTAVVDLPLKPEGPEIGGAVDACPVRAAHPYLPMNPEFHEALQAFLDGDPLPECPAWRHLVGPLGRPPGMPPAGR